MTEMVRVAGIGEQVALIARLRWRIFRNSLRSSSARLDLAGLIIVGVLLTVFTAGVGVGMGVGAYFMVSQGRVSSIAALLWAIFLAWHFFPIMAATSSGSFDFRNLLRFPLRFSAFFLLSLAYGLSDPMAVMCVLWLGCVAAGMALARPELLPWALLVLGTFAVMNLALSRAIFSWLERLLARRRTREALFAIFLLLVFSIQLVSAAGSRWQRRIEPYWRAARPVLRVLPPGLGGDALASAAHGKFGQAAESLALLASYGALFGLLLRSRLRAQYLGEDLGESQAPTIAPAAGAPATATSSALITSSFLPGPVAAVCEKELRYLLRNTMALMSLAIPLILIAVFSLQWSSPRPGRGGQPFFTRAPELAFPGAVAYMLLVLAPFAHNSFAYDGRGIQLLYLAPVRFRDVLLGKNLVLASMVALETGLVWALISFLARPPGALVVAATLSALPFFLIVHFMVGNWLSLKFPRRFEIGKSRQRASGMTVLAGLGLQIALVAIMAVIVLAARLAGKMWLLPIVLLALGAAALAVYRESLEAFDRLAERQREVLTAQLCR